MYSQVSYKYSNSINLIIKYYFIAVHFKEENYIYKYDFTAYIFTFIVAYYTAIATRLNILYTFTYKI